MSQPITAINAVQSLQQLPEMPATWLATNYGMATATPTYYHWQTLPPQNPTSLSPQQGLNAGSAFYSPRTALPMATTASNVGGSSELPRLFDNVNDLAGAIVNHGAMVEQAEKLDAQNKELKQKQLQAQILQEQNNQLALAVKNLQQQAANPATARPVAMAMPASAYNFSNLSSTLGLYTPGFSTAGMGLTPQVAPATTTTTTPATTPTTPSTNTQSKPTSATPASSAVTGGSSKNQSIANTAQSLIGLNSKENSPPETKDGRLACAWFVNEVLKKVYGHTFPKKGNTLLVDTVVAALKEEGATEVSPSNLEAGDIVYVPGKKPGQHAQHIGVIADDGGKHIIHNSSSKGIAYKTKGATFESYKGQPHLYLRPKSA